MAASMATMMIGSAAVATPAAASSFRGERVVVSRGVSVAPRRSVFVVRAEDKGAGKNLQDAGEQFSAAVQRGAESVKANLQGTQSDVSSKAKNAAGTAESKAKQGANQADSLGAKISNQAEDLKDKVFGAGNDAEKNLNKAQRSASAAGKDAENKAGNVLGDLQQGLSDAADNVSDTFKGKK